MLTETDARITVYAPVERELAQVIAELRAVAADERDLSSSGAVQERLAHILSAPGKRIRPAITLLAARLWGHRDNGAAVRMATAVEILHIATLVHDDTVDRADVRRGQATASNLWGDEIAVLLGDYLFAASARYVCDTNCIRVIRRFSETIMELARGELNELLDAGKPTVGRAAYFQRIYDKTASLFCTAAESGAVLSNASEDEISRLRDYGYNVGMAYQVVDDVLDFDSTDEELGKPACHDLQQGVLTLPAIMLMERAPRGNPILRMLSADGYERGAHLAAAVETIRSSGILDSCVEMARGYVTAAYRALDAFPNSEEKAALLALAEFVGDRRY